MLTKHLTSALTKDEIHNVCVQKAEPLTNNLYQTTAAEVFAASLKGVS